MYCQLRGSSEQKKNECGQYQTSCLLRNIPIGLICEDGVHHKVLDKRFPT